MNGDGDTRDHFLHVHDAKTGVTTNTGLVPANLFLDCSVGGFQLDRGRVLLGNFGAFRSRPLVLYDAEPDRSVNLGPTLGWFHNTLGIAGDRIAFGLSERVQGEDLNDDGDLEDESILHIADLSAVSFPVPFRRADANADGGVNLTDGIYILDWLFRGGPEPPCRDAADADDNGAVELTDAVGIFGWLFLGHKPPPAPGPTECGTDPTAEKSAPGCLAYGHCP